jgi:hypothetical protein
MDSFFSTVEHAVRMAGWPVHVLTWIAWAAVFHEWTEARRYRNACHRAVDAGMPMPEPNAWIRFSRLLMLLACFLLWLSILHWAQVQQKPIRA